MMFTKKMPLIALLIAITAITHQEAHVISNSESEPSSKTAANGADSSSASDQTTATAQSANGGGGGGGAGGGGGEHYVRLRDTPPPIVMANTGSSLVLECEAAGSPSPTIHWLRNGHRITQGLDDLLMIDSTEEEGVSTGSDQTDPAAVSLSLTKSRLFLDCLHHGRDSAVYTCVAETPYTRVTADSHVKVLPSGLYSFTTNSALLPRHTAMYPHKRSSNSLINRLRHKKNSPHGTDAEEMLENRIPHSAHSSSLGPMCGTSKKSSIGKPARVHMWTHNKLDIIGQDAVLYCRAAGSPSPRVRWTGPWSTDEEAEELDSAGHHLGTRSSDANKYRVLPTGDLLIRDLSWDDMGSYTCIVSNELGRDSVSTFLYPAAPEDKR